MGQSTPLLGQTYGARGGLHEATLYVQYARRIPVDRAYPRTGWFFFGSKPPTPGPSANRE